VRLRRTAIALGLRRGADRGHECLPDGIIRRGRVTRPEEEQERSGEKRPRAAPQHRRPPQSVISLTINSPIQPTLTLGDV